MSEAECRDDPAFVARQLRHAAEAVKDRRCFWCGSEPPGLMFQPSEEGVCEMPFWTCGCYETEQTAEWFVARGILLERYGPCAVCERPFTEDEWDDRHTPRAGGDAHSACCDREDCRDSVE